jgi:hypothetical protein
MKIFNSPLIVYIILVLLIIIYITRKSNNNDIIKENCKDKLTDIANIKNARKYYSKKKTFKYLLIAFFITLIGLLLCDFTKIDINLINYFAYEIHQEQEINKNLYLVPIYLLIIREIILEVKIGDFLFKYYKVEEPVLEEGLLKTLLYKKPVKQQTTKSEKKEESK